MEKANQPVTVVSAIPLQRCPICEGKGNVPTDGSSTSLYETCPKCNGDMVIPMHAIYAVDTSRFFMGSDMGTPLSDQVAFIESTRKWGKNPVFEWTEPWKYQNGENWEVFEYEHNPDTLEDETADFFDKYSGKEVLLSFAGGSIWVIPVGVRNMDTIIGSPQNVTGQGEYLFQLKDVQLVPKL